MAYVEANVEEVFPVNYYIDDEGYNIASDFELLPHQIDAVYKAVVLYCFGKYDEAAEAILPALGTLDPGPSMRYLSYLFLAKEYDKLIEKCNKITKFDERTELRVKARRLLGVCYEEGFGTEKDMILAFRNYNLIRLENDISDEAYELLDDFLKRHPEMLELPEVQSALAPFDEDEDY